MLIDLKSIPIYILSLDTNGERFKSLHSDLKKLKLADNIQYVGGAKSKYGSLVGCALAHKKAMQLAIRSHNVPYLILEDDARIIEDSYMEEFSVPDDAGAVYIGYVSSRVDIEIAKWKFPVPDKYPFTLKTVIPYAQRVPEYKNICRIHGVLAAHAVVHTSVKASKQFVKYIDITVEDPRLPHDLAWAKLHIDIPVYATNFPMFKQVDNRSTKEWTHKLSTKSIFEVTKY